MLTPLLRGEMVNGNLTDGDDEILESLVKTATKAPTTRTTPRERKRTRHVDRKSCKYFLLLCSYYASLGGEIDLFPKTRTITLALGGRLPLLPLIFKKRSF